MLGSSALTRGQNQGSPVPSDTLACWQRTRRGDDACARWLWNHASARPSSSGGAEATSAMMDGFWLGRRSRWRGGFNARPRKGMDGAEGAAADKHERAASLAPWKREEERAAARLLIWRPWQSKCSSSSSSSYSYAWLVLQTDHAADSKRLDPGEPASRWLARRARDAALLGDGAPASAAARSETPGGARCAVERTCVARCKEIYYIMHAPGKTHRGGPARVGLASLVEMCSDKNSPVGA